MRLSTIARRTAWSFLALFPAMTALAGEPPAPQKSGARRSAKKESRPPRKIDPAELPGEIRRLVDKHSSKGWQVGVVILDDAGKPLVQINPDQAFSPASNQKILVVGAALGVLGPKFEYETTLSAKGPVQNGAVQDLVVKGNGDPNISARFHNGDPTAVFRSWAGELKKKGLLRVAGDLVVDDTAFDNVRFLPGWKENQAGNWYSAEVSALNLNDNCIDISVFPTKPGQPARYELKPATAYVTVENKCRTVERKQAKPIFLRAPGENTIQIKEEIAAAQKSFLTSITVEDPAMYFGTVLAEVLRAEGIAVEGKVVRGKLAERAGAAPAVLLRHASPLLQDLPVINRRSQNLHAEILLKALGMRKAGEGSVASGARAILDFLQSAGIPSAGIRIEDGSGLAAGNRVSPSTLASVLAWIRRQPFFLDYQKSLAVPGQDGTLKKRFRETKAASHISAKTGYIRGASALSGYVERGKKHWIFSILVNGLRGGKNYSPDITAVRGLEEEIAAAVFDAMPE